MNKVADLSESRELYALSGWDDTDQGVDWLPNNNTGVYELRGGAWFPAKGERIPAYDAGFLLGYLPAHSLDKQANGNFTARWEDYSDGRKIEAHSRTSPENALCRLAIKLFQADILKS